MDYKVWLDWRYNWPSYKVPITHETSDKVFYDKRNLVKNLIKRLLDFIKNPS